MRRQDRMQAGRVAPQRTCADCRHFRGQGRQIEASLPALRSLSSGFAATRGTDGICTYHDRLLRAGAHCADHAPTHA